MNSNSARNPINKPFSGDEDDQNIPQSPDYVAGFAVCITLGVMALSIDYQLDGAGWSRCKVSLGEVELELTASYLSDALASLVLGAVSVLAGATSISFGFDEEPGEYRWAISRTTATEIKVRLLEFEELWSNRPDGDGQVMAEFVCNALEFGIAVQAAANEVLARHGLLGYKKAWVEHEFPSKQLDILSDYVSKWKSWQQ